VRVSTAMSSGMPPPPEHRDRVDDVDIREKCE
jgi:hypothetical protein